MHWTRFVHLVALMNQNPFVWLVKHRTVQPKILSLVTFHLTKSQILWLNSANYEGIIIPHILLCGQVDMICIFPILAKKIHTMKKKYQNKKKRKGFPKLYTKKAYNYKCFLYIYLVSISWAHQSDSSKFRTCLSDLLSMNCWS